MTLGNMPMRALGLRAEPRTGRDPTVPRPLPPDNDRVLTPPGGWRQETAVPPEPVPQGTRLPQQEQWRNAIIAEAERFCAAYPTDPVCHFKDQGSGALAAVNTSVAWLSLGARRTIRIDEIRQPALLLSSIEPRWQ
jgi:hypothetical protein